jgi:hypothetical protein
VQRGVRHYFRNTGKDLAASFVTFSPPFDGRDTVTAEVPAEAAPEAAPASPAPPPKPKSWWHFWGPGDTSEPAPKP